MRSTESISRGVLRLDERLLELQLLILPMFLFSATFYPLSIYPEAIRVFVRLTPLYHGIHLLRAVTLGRVSVTQLGDVGYLLVMGAIGLVVAQRRIGGLLHK